MDHAYIHQVADQLCDHGIAVSHIHIDTPEQAEEMGREYARLDLTGTDLAQSLIWSDHSGWTTSTWADHYPILPGQISPIPEAVVKEAASHIHTLAHGGHLQAL